MAFIFVSGNLALDFMGTLKWRRSEPEELLATPADLGRWAVEAGVMSEAPAVDAADLRRLRTLREAVYRLVTTAMDGRPWPEDDLRVVNEEAAGAPPRMRLTPAGLVRSGDAGAIASSVARSAAELLGEFGELRVRECALEECTRIFIDRSRGGNRQWCGMEECGNRVKVANYRSRKSQAAPS
ncbi:putative RNA-binding Zn ribbon-like protein [Nonomuraea polychroma]|uniref:Putative RNA-binding Zn ribbon-like protein n=1 Tax=Nonomuraea polychroma TaxID=46176 RepID=A0A438M479_9ACTN|nr:CGNR zinc finger domain-containing protein [Nonomuraea polychroma]RVX40387.1 putative RNA-binding Zn ribbon-like protein [Nonomuraea polychroma]